MRHDDLQSPVLHERYPGAEFSPRSHKSRRRTYTTQHAGRHFFLSVTPANTGAGAIEIRAIEGLSKFSVPVPELVDAFEDGRRHYLLQAYAEGTALDDALAGAASAESFALGEVMGQLLQTIHSIPTSAFADGLPSPTTTWWDWLMSLEPKLRPPVSLTSKNVNPTFVHNDFLPHNILLDPTCKTVAALIDFEWCFLGDPMWDVGYLEWWLEQGDYPHSEKCREGAKSAYELPTDDQSGRFYASLREAEDRTWWWGSTPPPIGWLRRASNNAP